MQQSQTHAGKNFAIPVVLLQTGTRLELQLQTITMTMGLDHGQTGVAAGRSKQILNCEFLRRALQIWV